MIKIGNKQLDIIIAKTREEQIQGLSGLELLPQDTCLIFPFSVVPNDHLFNTTKMLFSIDIICIKNGKIIHMEKNVEKGKMFISLPGSNFIIEMNAGLCDEGKWVTGTPVYGLDKL